MNKILNVMQGIDISNLIIIAKNFLELDNFLTDPNEKIMLRNKYTSKTYFKGNHVSMSIFRNSHKIFRTHLFMYEERVISRVSKEVECFITYNIELNNEEIIEHYNDLASFYVEVKNLPKSIIHNDKISNIDNDIEKMKNRIQELEQIKKTYKD